MSRSMRKACDACSLRKVQCDGDHPCRRCVAYSFQCTFLKSRGKPGPKGPRKKTAEAIESLQSGISSDQEPPKDNPQEIWASPDSSNNGSDLLLDSASGQDRSPHDSADWAQSFDHSVPFIPTEQSAHSRIQTSCIARYLNKFEFRAYSIWPVF